MKLIRFDGTKEDLVGKHYDAHISSELLLFGLGG